MPETKINRRMFIRLAALAGIGAGVAFLEHITKPVGAMTFTRWMLRANLRRLNPPSIVALGYCPSYEQDILSKLRDLWLLAEMPDLSGKKILVKPNLVDMPDNYPRTTAPQVVGGVIDLLRELGAREIAVGDGSAFRRDTASVAANCGLLDVLTIRGVPFIDLNYDDPQPVRVKDGWLRRSPWLWLPSHVRNADFIVSVPKLKTHHWAGVSLSMKNLIGVVPGSRYGWAKNMIHLNAIAASIIGIYQLMPPVLAVVDGIVGMEGDGPLFGTPVAHGLLAVGCDPLAVDITCTQLMGFSIDKIPHLNVALWAGVGKSQQIETRGHPADQLQKKYQPPPSNVI